MLNFVSKVLMKSNEQNDIISIEFLIMIFINNLYHVYHLFTLILSLNSDLEL